jgi:hypothetical protein
MPEPLLFLGVLVALPMGKPVRTLWIVAIALSLAACGQPVEITAFHTLNEKPAGKSFEVVPDERQQSSLEWKAYASMVASKLESNGLRQVGAQGDADFGVFVFYYIDSGTTSVSAMPIYGQTSAGRTTTTTTYVGRTPIYQTSYTPPTYGVTGYTPVSHTTFSKGLIISMMDIKKSMAERRPVTVYEARVTSAGSASSLNQIVPAMVAAVFQDWPGKSGTTRRVEVQLQD